MNYRKQCNIKTRPSLEGWMTAAWVCQTGERWTAAGRTEHGRRLELSPYFSTFKSCQLMRNIFQLKQAWNHEVLLKWRVMGEHTHKHTHNSNYSCVCAFVNVTESSVHISSVNCYFAVECFLIMQCFVLDVYISLWKTMIKSEWYIINSW